MPYRGPAGNGTRRHRHCCRLNASAYFSHLQCVYFSREVYSVAEDRAANVCMCERNPHPELPARIPKPKQASTVGTRQLPEFYHVSNFSDLISKTLCCRIAMRRLSQQQ